MTLDFGSMRLHPAAPVSDRLFGVEWEYFVDDKESFFVFCSGLLYVYYIFFFIFQEKYF